MNGSLWHIPTILVFLRWKLRDFVGFGAVEGGRGSWRRLRVVEEEEDEEEEKEDCLSFLHLGVCFLGIPGSCSQENGIPKERAGEPG